MTKTKFEMSFSNEEVRELLADHLDERVFGMSVNSVDPTSVSFSIDAEGGLRVSGKFIEEQT